MTGNAALQAAERARDADRARRRREARGSRRVALVFADGRVFDAEDPEKGMAFADAVVVAEARDGTLGTTGSYRPPKSRRASRAAASGRAPSYSYSAARRRGRRRSRDRHLHRAEDLDRARRRPRDQQGARDGSGRRQRLHGARRGDDGGDGLSAEPLRRAQDPVDARVQEPGHRRHAGGDHLHRRGPGPQRSVRREGMRPRPAAADHARRRQRRVRRRRRARRRDPGHAREDLRRDRERKPRARRPRYGPTECAAGRVARAAQGAHALAGRHRRRRRSRRRRPRRWEVKN